MRPRSRPCASLDIVAPDLEADPDPGLFVRRSVTAAATCRGAAAPELTPARSRGAAKDSGRLPILDGCQELRKREKQHSILCGAIEFSSRFAVTRWKDVVACQTRMACANRRPATHEEQNICRSRELETNLASISVFHKSIASMCRHDRSAHLRPIQSVSDSLQCLT